MAEGDYPQADGEVVYASEVNAQLPIGSVISWAKNLTGVPSLPSAFVECNGQVLSDAESPLDGQTIPDLNGGNRFLRGGSTSGTTGGAATTAAHNHQWHSDSGSGTTGAIEVEGAAAQQTYNSAGSLVNFNISSGYIKGNYYTTNENSHNNEPQYYQMVMIMRVK